MLTSFCLKNKIQVESTVQTIDNRTLCRPVWSLILFITEQIGLPLRDRPILLIARMIKTNWAPLSPFTYKSIALLMTKTEGLNDGAIERLIK